MNAYKKLEEHFAEYSTLREIEGLLNWDTAVLLPEKGIEQRSKQCSVMAKIAHDKLTDPAVGDLINQINRSELDNWQLANLAVVKRLYDAEASVPSKLFAAKKNQSVKTEAIWAKARKENNFNLVSGELEELLNLSREAAELKAESMGLDPYDALLDEYSPYLKSSDIDIVFDDLANFLPPFLNTVLSKQSEPLPFKSVAVYKQKSFNTKVAELLGFDFARGRLDVSAHPFSCGGGGDVRITVRYDENDFFSSLQSVVHETGHALFDMHTPQNWLTQPVGCSLNMGMAIHESQSLALEMQLGRSKEFLQVVSFLARSEFGESGDEFSADNFYYHAVKVKRGLIRIEADEVTYPLHIILRYRLEKDLLAGSLKVKDLPEAWNEAMRDLIGVVPPNDSLGCMQDVHWYCGAFGYFPSYALGEIIAAQMVNKMKQDVPDVFEQVSKGNIEVFTGWLKTNVHNKACLYTPPELVEKVTGKPMSAEFLKQHLTERYLN